jgi:hypothetical protein
MKTTCEFCLFSKKSDAKQIGCEFNRLDIFKKEYENGHYVLEGYCNMCRNENWYFHRDNPNASTEDLKNKAKLENTFKYSIVINGIDSSEEKILKTLNSLPAIELKPVKVFILTNFNIDKAKNFYINNVEDKKNTKMDIFTYLPSNKEDYPILVNNRIYSLTNHVSLYIIKIEAGEIFESEESDLITEINKNIIENNLYVESIDSDKIRLMVRA